MHTDEMRTATRSNFTRITPSLQRRTRQGLSLMALLATLAGAQCASRIEDDTVPLIEVQEKTRVRLETSKGAIVIELFAQQAPITVANFLQYVNEGFYDGLVFHEAISDRPILGDSVAAGVYTEDLTPRTDGLHDPVANESNNGLSNTRGRVALLEPDGAGTGTSAFRIQLSNNQSQDYDLETGERGLTVFGRVVEGLDVAEAISELTTTTRTAGDGESLANVPTETVTILKAFIDTGQFTGPNAAPVAVAGPDLTTLVGQATSLDGSASSDPDEDELSYFWRQTSGPTVTLSGTNVSNPSFTPDAVATLTFELTVTDTRGATGTDAVTVTVGSPDNEPPTADAGPDQTVQAGGTATLDASASSDPDNQTLTYAWTQSGGTTVTLSDPAAANPTFTAPASGGTLTFDLSVTDTLGGQATDSVTVSVNQNPVADAGADRKVFAGIITRLRGASSDPDGDDALQFSWAQIAGPNVALSDPSAEHPTFTVLAGTEAFTFEVTVTDGRGGSATDSVVLTPVAEPRVRLSTSTGDIVLDMLEDGAPITVTNFLQYVDDQFYDGTIIHRVSVDRSDPNNPRPFVIQGGGFLPDLSEQSGVRDAIQNEFGADRSNVRGTVAMAKRGGDPNSATSQFFINLSDNSDNLDNQNGGFTVFASVLEGIDVVDEIAEVDTSTQQDPDGNSFSEVPVEDIVVNTATIE